MAKIYITRVIPEVGIQKLIAAGHTVEVNAEDKVLSKDELVAKLQDKGYDAILSLLTDKIDAEVLAAAGPQCKIVANYAVGFDNINLEDAKNAGVVVTNTPGALTDTVAEHALTLMLTVAHRITEADNFTKAGRYKGWEPMMLLGHDLSKKTVGILGLGRIGSRLAYMVKRGFDCRVLYYDIKPNADFEKEFGAEFVSVQELLKQADFVSVHVPLLDSTRHLINKDSLVLMKPTAILVNTSRGPVIDESALVDALKHKTIRGAGLDVFENEPALAEGLAELSNVVLTPHIASATEETRNKMAEIAADNIIAVLNGGDPLTPVV